MEYLRANGRYNKVITYKRGGKRKSVTWTDKTKLSVRGVNLYHQTCQQIFTALFHEASLIENQFSKIIKEKHIKVKRKAFTEDELKLVKENANDNLMKLFMFGLYTGLREGDICTLKCAEIDLGLNLINCVMDKTRSSSGKMVSIPILPPLRPLIEKCHSNDEEYMLAAAGKDVPELPQ